MISAPVILFVYNRPEHTLKTLQALKANTLAKETTLYVYADGPKENASEDQLQHIAAVRQTIRSEAWCGSINIIESDVNKGLARSITEGVTEILNHHPSAIILEDDIITAPGFLQYMNDCLRIYADKEEVMSVSGYMYPIETHSSNILFLKFTSCWGWATWQRAWKFFESDTLVLLERIKTKQQKKNFNIEGNADFYGQLQANEKGVIKTWAVKWYASCWKRGGYTIYPHKTLITNIGHDGSGEHCPASYDMKYNSRPASNVDVVQKEIIEDKASRIRIDIFHKKLSVVPFALRAKRLFWHKPKILFRKKTEDLLKKLALSR